MNKTKEWDDRDFVRKLVSSRLGCVGYITKEDAERERKEMCSKPLIHKKRWWNK